MHNPFVPETHEGWSALHLVFRVDWPRLGGLPPGERARMAAEVEQALGATVPRPADGGSALVQLLGHKGDLMVIVFRPSFDELGRVELALARTGLHGYLHATYSYVSIVELGMYEMTAKIHRQFGGQGLTPAPTRSTRRSTRRWRGSARASPGGCFRRSRRRATSASTR